MAEAKNSFIKSKMNKDLDARLLPNGEYREGINIQVSKSEGADVGALENVLGNIELVDLKAESECNCDLTTIGLYTDEVNNNIYIFLTDYDERKVDGYNDFALNYSSTANNFIYVYNIVSKIPTQLIKGAFLNFSITHPILSINLLEGILFWTDNRNQPRKINVLKATTPDYYTNEDQISVATYAPFQPIQLYKKREGSYLVQSTDTQGQNYNPYFDWNNNIVPIWPNGGAGISDGITTVSPPSTAIILNPQYREGLARDFSPSNTKVLVGALVTALDPSTGVQIAAFSPNTVLADFDTSNNAANLILKSNLSTGSPPAPTILDIPDGSIICFNQNVVPGTSSPLTLNDQWATSMEDASTPMNPGDTTTYSSDTPGLTTNPNYNPQFNGDPDFLEDKFVRFSYRFKYEDGNYSVMAPFTQAAFIPQQDGYFLDSATPASTPLGMTSDEQATYRSTVVNFMENKVNNIYLELPLPLDKDNNGIPANQLFNLLKIDEIEILYKESDSLAIQVVDTIPRAGEETGYERFGTATTIEYNYQGSKPYKTLPASETVRVYDKVPVKAHGQEIISNRLVYSNFQNKHTPPETIDYNVGVSDKITLFSVHEDNPDVQRPIERTVSREYPMHTIKQNRNYQVGIVLSDRYGRSSTTILSSVNKQAINADDLTLIGDTIYFPYNDISSILSTSNNINSWPGDSIKILFNTPLDETPHDTVNGWPGLYNGDSTISSNEPDGYNPLGWYSYKIVVKQTEQEYYNVYLPSIMNFYPNYTAAEQTSPTNDTPDPLKSVSFITLLNDNINKVPRDLIEVGPEQKQFRSSVQLYGRIAPKGIAIPLNNYQFNPVDVATRIAIADTVSTISDQNDLFDNTNGTKDEYGAIYQTVSNPSLARISISGDAIGTLPPTLIEDDQTQWLSVYETEPVESRLDIYWETSSSGTISELNTAIKEGDSGIKDFTTEIDGGSGPDTWTFNLAEDVEPNDYITATYSATVGSSGTYTSKPFFPYSIDATGFKTAIINSDINVNGGFWVKNSLQETVTNKFVLTRTAGGGSPDTYTIQIAADTRFYYGPEGEGEDSIAKNTFSFNFQVINNDANGKITHIVKFEKLLNVAPIITCESSIVVQPGQTPIFSFEGVNGTNDNSKNTEDLRWSITSQDPVGDGIPELTITNENGKGVVKDPCADRSCEPLNQPVALAIALTDAGTTETTIKSTGGTGGNPIGTCEPQVDGNTGYETFSLNDSFGSVKNMCINQASESSGFYWADPSNDPVTTTPLPGIDREPVTGLTNDTIDSPWTVSTASSCSGWNWSNSNRNMEVSMNETNSGLGTAVVSGRSNCKTTGPLLSPEGITKGTTAQPGGSAYIIVDFELGNYGGTPSDRPGVIWPTYLQYRQDAGSTWVNATDVEGNLIKFGGAQANTYYRSNSDSAVTVGGGNSYSNVSQPTKFYTTGVKDQLNSAINQEGSSESAPNPAKIDSFESWMESRTSTQDPRLISVGRKVFVIGRNQAYREPSGNAPTDAPDRFGEYRLITRYPYGNNISPTTSASQTDPIIPTLGINSCPDTINPIYLTYAGYANGQLYQRVYLSFGDFYNSNQLISNYNNGEVENSSIAPAFFAYRINSLPQDSRAAASTTNPNQVVYAREWAFQYISQFYLNPELDDEWKPEEGDKWFAYQGNNDDNSINVKWGNEYASTRAGAPIWEDPNTGVRNGENLSFRDMKWTAQFDIDGKKIIKTAQPCVADLDPVTGGNASPCEKPVSPELCSFGTLKIKYESLGNDDGIMTMINTNPWANPNCNITTLFYKLSGTATEGNGKTDTQIEDVADITLYSPQACYARIGMVTFNRGYAQRSRIILSDQAGAPQITITHCTVVDITAFPGIIALNWLFDVSTIPGGCCD